MPRRNDRHIHDYGHPRSRSKRGPKPIKFDSRENPRPLEEKKGDTFKRHLAGFRERASDAIREFYFPYVREDENGLYVPIDFIGGRAQKPGSRIELRRPSAATQRNGAVAISCFVADPRFYEDVGIDSRIRTVLSPDLPDHTKVGRFNILLGMPRADMRGLYNESALTAVLQACELHLTPVAEINGKAAIGPGALNADMLWHQSPRWDY